MTARLFFLTVFLFFFHASAQAALLGGNTSGPVTLLEVYDYQCPHCIRMAPIVQQLADKNPELRIQYMPVALLNENSYAQASIAIAGAQIAGAFFALHNTFMHNGQPMTANQIVNTLKEYHLNTPHFVQLMKDQKTKEQLQEGRNVLRHFHQKGVPFFVVYANNAPQQAQTFAGETSFAVLNAAIQKVKTEVPARDRETA